MPFPNASIQNRHSDRHFPYIICMPSVLQDGAYQTHLTGERLRLIKSEFDDVPKFSGLTNNQTGTRVLVSYCRVLTMVLLLP